MKVQDERTMVNYCSIKLLDNKQKRTMQVHFSIVRSKEGTMQKHCSFERSKQKVNVRHLNR